MGDIGNRQQRDLSAIESAAACRSAGFGFGATGLFLLVMLSGRFVQ